MAAALSCPIILRVVQYVLSHPLLALSGSFLHYALGGCGRQGVQLEVCTVAPFHEAHDAWLREAVGDDVTVSFASPAFRVNDSDDSSTFLLTAQADPAAPVVTVHFCPLRRQQPLAAHSSLFVAGHHARAAMAPALRGDQLIAFPGDGTPALFTLLDVVPSLRCSGSRGIFSGSLHDIVTLTCCMKVVVVRNPVAVRTGDHAYLKQLVDHGWEIVESTLLGLAWLCNLKSVHHCCHCTGVP
jgi:hypothetical protein